MKKFRLHSILVILLCLFILAGCSKKDEGEFKQISKIDGVVFSVPETWKEVKAEEVSFSQLMDIGTVVQFSFDKKGRAQFIPFSLPQGFNSSPKNLLLIMENQIINNINAENKVVEDNKIGDKDAVRFGYEFEQDGEKKFADIYIVIKDRNAYLISFKNNLDEVKQTSKNIDLILKSFKFE